MKPSNYLNRPIGSILQNCQSEIIARNIMVILARTGDEWRLLTWKEYESERQKDGEFTESEKRYFQKVIPYCISNDKANKFCKDWGK